MLADLHGLSFARAWSEMEVEALLLDKAVTADGAFAGSPAGLAGFVLTRLAADEAEILSVTVTPRSRGVGVASRLMRRHLATLRDRGVRLLFLEVAAGNEPALALYRRLGFTEVGRREAYYGAVGGARSDALVMRLPLG